MNEFCKQAANSGVLYLYCCYIRDLQRFYSILFSLYSLTMHAYYKLEFLFAFLYFVLLYKSTVTFLLAFNFSMELKRKISVRVMII